MYIKVHTTSLVTVAM